MRIQIVAIGRMKQGPERDLMSRYLDRAVGAGRPLALTGFAVQEFPESRAPSAADRRADEARSLGAALAGSVVVALDEHGKSMPSGAFASLLAGWRDDGRQTASFMIGGPDGLDAELVRRADLTLSFSPFTWPHQLVRIMLAEQLYRACTILAGHPYHRD